MLAERQDSHVKEVATEHTVIVPSVGIGKQLDGHQIHHIQGFHSQNLIGLRWRFEVNALLMNNLKPDGLLVNKQSKANAILINQGFSLLGKKGGTRRAAKGAGYWLACADSATLDSCPDLTPGHLEKLVFCRRTTAMKKPP